VQAGTSVSCQRQRQVECKAKNDVARMSWTLPSFCLRVKCIAHHT